MTTYRVQRMTTEEYSKYMGGALYYEVENLYIEAESLTEAVQKAYKAGYVVNGSAKTVEELENEKKRRAEEEKEEARKKAEKKAKALAKEQAKAEEKGMTLENYKKWKRASGEARRLQKMIENLNEALAEKEALMRRMEKA